MGYISREPDQIFCADLLKKELSHQILRVRIVVALIIGSFDTSFKLPFVSLAYLQVAELSPQQLSGPFLASSLTRLRIHRLSFQAQN